MTRQFDVLVLGAGIVGTCVAVHLQQRGRAVALIDRTAPGTETSYGNAGLIQGEGFFPYGFPRQLSALLKYAGNRAPDMRYRWATVLKSLPFLMRYWYFSEPSRHAAIARQYAPLIEHCVNEHRELASAAGVGPMIRKTGWLKIFRDHASQDKHVREAQQWHAEFGVRFETYDRDALRIAEPSLNPSLVGALRYAGADTVSDPGDLVNAYACHFESLGGCLLCGDANTLEPGWTVRSDTGQVRAKQIVVALGPWAADLLKQRLGLRLPWMVKRGYHQHFAPAAGTQLNHPVFDVANGFLLSPTRRGIRLITGAEFADRDAPKSPDQIRMLTPVARDLLPLGQAVETTPWMGARPCTPDMMPVIGRAPRHQDVWLAIGHAHHGLTLGPVTGRLLTEMMTGSETLMDPTPYRADRF